MICQAGVSDLDMESAAKVAHNLRKFTETCQLHKVVKFNGGYELSIETKDTTINFAQTALDSFAPAVEECVVKDESLILLFLYFVESKQKEKQVEQTTN